MPSKEDVLVKGLRFNNGKLSWGLLSWPALRELVKVLEFGAKKYASWNWSNGLSWTETFESLQRHLLAWYTGEEKDPETGLSHIAHVMCNAMFLMHFVLFGTGRDDRPDALKGDSLVTAPNQATPTKPSADPVVERGVSHVQADLFASGC